MYSRRDRWRRGDQGRTARSGSRRRASHLLKVEHLEPRELLAVVVSSLSGTEGFPINTQVATFTAADVTGTSPQAMINWGDGHTTTGTIVTNATGLGVVGANTYTAPGTYPVSVTITSTGGSTAFGQGQAAVTPVPLSGQLDPLSDTGSSNTDGITAINQPTFVGTAQPYAIVELFARRSDQAEPNVLGQTVANVVGDWNLSVGALPDGVYSFSVTEIPPTGQPAPMVSLTPASVVIDTVPPTVLGATARQGSGEIRVVLKDSLSGLAPSTLSNPANYALLGPGGSRIGALSAMILPYPTVRASDSITVALRFNGVAKFKRGLTIALGGITDLAGNGLAREHVLVSLVSHGHAGAGHSPRLAAHGHHG